MAVHTLDMSVTRRSRKLSSHLAAVSEVTSRSLRSRPCGTDYSYSVPQNALTRLVPDSNVLVSDSCSKIDSREEIGTRVKHTICTTLYGPEQPTQVLQDVPDEGVFEAQACVVRAQDCVVGPIAELRDAYTRNEDG